MLSSIYDDVFSSWFSKGISYAENRWDIFVESLVVLGYIVRNEEGKYELAVDFDKDEAAHEKRTKTRCA